MSHKKEKRSFTFERNDMSIIHSTNEGWILSHLEYLNNVYRNVKSQNGFCTLLFNEMLFEINSQYLRQNQIASATRDHSDVAKNKSKKRKLINQLSQEDFNEINFIKKAFENILSSAKQEGLFSSDIKRDNNELARATSQKFYADTFSQKLENLHGSNDYDNAIISEVQDEKYVFPEKCSFYSYDVRYIEQKMDLHNQYDFVLLDPPWWNKSIRRKKGKYVEASYKMMYNEELVKIPIRKLLQPNGIIAIWCTNAPSHLYSIFNDMFPAWGITYVAKWYWVKATQTGDTVCNFNLAPGKQPYELLILGSALKNCEVNIPNGKVLISVPSAVHSHKPPIIEILKDYLPVDPKCLEIFARYLLPGWTSWGLEVLKFQQFSLYTTVKELKTQENSISN